MTHNDLAEIAYDSVVYLHGISSKGLYLNISFAYPICAAGRKRDAVPV
jgi:hypothetical protein